MVVSVCYITFHMIWNSVPSNCVNSLPEGLLERCLEMSHCTDEHRYFSPEICSCD